MSFQDLLQLLRNEEETIVLELLEIHSDELVDKFLERIEERREEIYKHFL
jgi:tRNA A37 methylthiotransferase MiaB